MNEADMVAFALETQKQNMIGAILKWITVSCAILVMGTVLYLLLEDLLNGD